VRRAAWSEVTNDERISSALKRVRDELETLAGLLEAVQGRGKGLDSCLARCEQLEVDLAALSDDEREGEIRWFETQRQSFRLNRTPLEIRALFKAQMERYQGGWIFTSATLAVGESFHHFQRQLGLDEAETALWGSPFDYPGQALWFVPRGLPEPRSPDYTRMLVEDRQLLGGRGCARGCALLRDHRQTPLRLARGSGASGPHRGPAQERGQSVHGVPGASGCDRAETGGRASDPGYQ